MALQDPEDYGSDENGWKDGHVAHRCGHYIEEHSLSDERDARGRRKWVCPA